MMFGRDYSVHGDQRIEGTPRGIDRVVSVLCGMISLCDKIGRLHVPDRIAIHPLSNNMTCQRVQRACTDHTSRPCASWPFEAASSVEVVRLEQQS